MTTVARPAYDRASLTPGIVHIGVGNFHRAHMAVYLDDLFALGQDHDWAILGAGVRQGDARMREALAGQDNLSTVIELDPAGHRARQVGAMTGFLPVEPDDAALIEAMADPRIRIVSLTVTEGGYYVDSTGQFDPTHPDIVADAAQPSSPATAFGAILAALVKRRAAGVQPFTVMSCDNLPGNGHVTQNAVVGLAELYDASLAAWVKHNVAFPNGMVDRITPATGPHERELAQGFGLTDPVPVTCEPFRQWVLEDNFPAGRPALEKVGVTFTPHVHAYEAMKIRILNGGHAVIAYPSALMDLILVHEAMAHPLIAAFLHKVEVEEILPHVAPVPDTSIPDYLTLIESRFANPEIADTTRRLCLDGSNRQPKFIVPSLRDNLAKGIVPEGLILLSALWCRYCAGITDSGAVIEPNDPSWDALTTRAKAAKADPAQWLAMTEVYGDLGSRPEVVAAFTTALNAIWAEGTEAVLRRYLAS
ncbi:mannitol dehydrogenase [Cereibacter changlensis JA139]|uniref:Mannitol dehydrogenase n=2 Tax=Cereibacter changlensis TaxID=402884 RepID=A0A2T4JUQ4_9RHOB|nr:mannitol dehydrogenase family protein [Cereibacter changlensis]PTE21650.1 mannitol dehydrogenase [Cereibacter changlensis JA139]PZX57542.1 mannitol 2-dehydrogenase [Cereibacter changlensis]